MLDVACWKALEKVFTSRPTIEKAVPVSAVVITEKAYNWDPKAALLPYALALLFFAFTMVFAGRAQDRFYDAMEWLYGWKVENCLVS